MTRTEIDIYQHNGVKVVDSYTLYHKIGLTKTNYVRWIKKYRNRGGINKDWFISDKLLKLNRKIKTRYYFTLDYARAICFNYSTKSSYELIDLFKEEQTK